MEAPFFQQGQTIVSFARKRKITHAGTQTMFQTGIKLRPKLRLRSNLEHKLGLLKMILNIRSQHC